LHRWRSALPDLRGLRCSKKTARRAVKMAPLASSRRPILVMSSRRRLPFRWLWARLDRAEFFIGSLVVAGLASVFYPLSGLIILGRGFRWFWLAATWVSHVALSRFAPFRALSVSQPLGLGAFRRVSPICRCGVCVGFMCLGICNSQYMERSRVEIGVTKWVQDLPLDVWAGVVGCEFGRRLFQPLRGGAVPRGWRPRACGELPFI